MKVFVDTNVWLAGRFGRGLCADLLEALVEEDVEILLDERVLDEFRRVAREKLHVHARALAEADLFFRHHVRLVPAATEPAADMPDADDAWIIAAALGAGAELFVTGDKALLDLGAALGMPIVAPRTVYEQLRGLS